jgi:hypothetical protein
MGSSKFSSLYFVIMGAIATLPAGAKFLKGWQAPVKKRGGILIRRNPS